MQHIVIFKSESYKKVLHHIGIFGVIQGGQKK